MAKLTSGQEIQKRLAENITLLWTLCEVPGKPHENETRRGDDEGRQLPRDRERQLVDSFTFISASTDDSLRVTAVCIEEDPDKMGMTICLASNTKGLSHVTQGFNDIARTLEQASLRKNSRVDIRQDLFRQIVTLDEARILSRLRSCHAKSSRKTMGKPELLFALNRAVHDESILSRNKTARALITSIRSNAKRLSKRFSDFEKARGNSSPISVSQDILIEVLIEIDKFDVDGLQTVLAISRTLNPNLKASLPRALSKVGRYFRNACDLIDAARSPELTIFRRISVRPIDKPHVDMAFMADHSVGFDQAAQRVTGSSHQHLLNTYGSQSLSAARTKFQSRMSNCPVLWKVHAEVQLLLFYEQQPHVSRPRIIGSSKSACYLCDLFIQSHGEFCIPRTHGRLYDRWILPDHAVNGHLVSAIDRFNAVLEAKIQNTLRSKTRSLPHPNESVLLLRQPWPSNSTLAEPHEQASIQEVLDPMIPIHESPSRDQTGLPLVTLPCSPLTLTTTTSQDQFVAEAHVDNAPPDIHPSQPTEVICRLSLGDSMTHKLIHPQDTLIIETGPIRLHVSRDTNTLNTTSCWIHVQYPASQSHTANSNKDFESVNVDSLAQDSDIIVEAGAALSSKELALQIREHTIVVKYTFENPETRLVGKGRDI